MVAKEPMQKVLHVPTPVSKGLFGEALLHPQVIDEILLEGLIGRKRHRGQAQTFRNSSGGRRVSDWS